MKLDSQTFRELEIFQANDNAPSIFEHFALTQSQGGKRYLRRLFEKPLNSIDAIIEMQNTLRFLQNQNESWMPSFSGRQERVIENYFFSGLETVSSSFLPLASIQGIKQAFLYRNFRAVEEGCRETLQFLKDIQFVYTRYIALPKPQRLMHIWEKMSFLFEKSDIQKILSPNFSLGFGQVYRVDHILREKYTQDIRALMQSMFILDSLTAMVKGMKTFRLQFPKFVESDTPKLVLSGLRHPRLKNAVPNDLELSSGKHFLFLTGPNMAGKTTFLRAAALSVYLAHLGMGVPAENMTLTVFPAMLTSLQNEDNLELGYSYYYSEVRRVKQAAELIRDYPRTLIFMDELFRGTNYEDARKGTYEVIKRVLILPRTLFILSSHIYALGKELENESTAQLMRFNALLKKGEFHFSYQLEPGISTDAIGLEILKQEGVLELLDEASQANSVKVETSIDGSQ